MKTDICSMIEVKEVVEKKFIITFERKDRYNGVLVQCISEDVLNGEVFLVSVLKMIRKAQRIFVNKDDLVAKIDKSIVIDREKMSKRSLGNTLNYSSAPEVEYLDNKARSHRRS